jgi:hypothetical protein
MINICKILIFNQRKIIQRVAFDVRTGSRKYLLHTDYDKRKIIQRVAFDVRTGSHKYLLHTDYYQMKII